MRNFRLRPKGKWFPFLIVLLSSQFAIAQPSFPVNGVADLRSEVYAFTHATIVKDGQATLTNATLLISQGKIVAVGNNVALPKGAVEVDCSGKYIYPSFIDIYADYGIPLPERQRGGFDFRAPAQFNSNTKGAYGWNQAIRPEVNGSKDLCGRRCQKQNRSENWVLVPCSLTKRMALLVGTGVLVTLPMKKKISSS